MLVGEVSSAQDSKGACRVYRKVYEQWFKFKNSGMAALTRRPERATLDKDPTTPIAKAVRLGLDSAGTDIWVYVW